jgi:hypothetical protein
VQRCVGVLLGIEHPDEKVGVLDQAIHLEVVRNLSRVVVGQVKQDQAVELGVLSGRVQHAQAGDLVARWDAHPLQQPLRTVGTPGARQRPRGGGSAYTDASKLEVSQRVEQRRLARAGGTGKRDDRVIPRKAQPFAGTSAKHLGRRKNLFVDAPATRRDRLGQTIKAHGDVVGLTRERRDRVILNRRHAITPVEKQRYGADGMTVPL